jgi:hypothetical protein
MNRLNDAFHDAEFALLQAMNRLRIRGAVMPCGSLVAILDEPGDVGDSIGVVPGEWVAKL